MDIHRPFLSEHATQLLVQALVLFRLDYCNALLAGLPDSSIKPLQLIQNAAARLIFNELKRTYVTPLFIYLHSVADLGVGPEGHRPQLKSDWPLKCPCPVTHRGFTLALSRLKFNLCSASFTCKYEGTSV